MIKMKGGLQTGPLLHERPPCGITYAGLGLLTFDRGTTIAPRANIITPTSKAAFLLTGIHQMENHAANTTVA